MTAPAPTIHLNGTSAPALVNPIVEALRALQRAQSLHARCAPNARDYYPQGPGAYERARSAFQARVERFRQTAAELEELYAAIDDQVTARLARRPTTNTETP